MSDNDISKDKNVGYKKPPSKTQFKKGTSGNPKGRPKKQNSPSFLKICNNILNDTIDITEGGVNKRVTKKEALILSQLNKALSGNTASSKQIVSIIEKYIIPYEEKPEKPDQQPVVLIIDDIPRK